MQCFQPNSFIDDDGPTVTSCCLYDTAIKINAEIKSERMRARISMQFQGLLFFAYSSVVVFLHLHCLHLLRSEVYISEAGSA